MTLRILLDWKPSDREPPEEAATGAYIHVLAHNAGLTHYARQNDDQVGAAPYLSAYPLASWLAWNWWRLRWEPRYSGALKNSGWLAAHNMRRAGGGYVWPDITFASDGQTMLVMAKSTPAHPARPIRYVTDFLGVVPVGEFETAADHFIQATLSQLSSKDLRRTDLQIFYDELRDERADQDLAKYRRFEAMLGHDPDEGDETKISELIVESEDFGEESIQELAAIGSCEGTVPSVTNLQEVARDQGFSSNVSASVAGLNENDLPSYGHGPAWERGVKAARALRQRERLGDGPLDDERLSDMAGLPSGAVKAGDRGYRFTYAIRANGADNRFVHRSRWATGRRFDVARLIGDRVAVQSNAGLRTATLVSTYRQQLQKAFAAEFLAPIDSVDTFLDGDYDEDRQQEAANQFGVSPMMINSLLKNNNRIERFDYEVLDHLATTA
jgi:hypothetical protein